MRKELNGLPWLLKLKVFDYLNEVHYTICHKHWYIHRKNGNLIYTFFTSLRNGFPDGLLKTFNSDAVKAGFTIEFQEKLQKAMNPIDTTINYNLNNLEQRNKVRESVQKRVYFIGGIYFITRKVYPLVIAGLLSHDVLAYLLKKNLRYGISLLEVLIGDRHSFPLEVLQTQGINQQTYGVHWGGS